MRLLLCLALWGAIVLSLVAGCGGGDTKPNVVTTPLPPGRTEPK